MKITIESEERAGAPLKVSEEPGSVEVMEGGTPPQALLQLASEQATQPESERPTARDGGTPPQWLKESVEGSSSFAVKPADQTGDGGAAPSISEQ